MPNIPQDKEELMKLCIFQQLKPKKVNEEMQSAEHHSITEWSGADSIKKKKSKKCYNLSEFETWRWTAGLVLSLSGVYKPPHFAPSCQNLPTVPALLQTSTLIFTHCLALRSTLRLSAGILRAICDEQQGNGSFQDFVHVMD